MVAVVVARAAPVAVVGVAVVVVAGVVVAGTKVTGLWRGAGVRCVRSVLLVAADTVGLVLGFGVVDGMAIDRRSWVSLSTI